MTSITGILARHLAACDERFAAAEADVVEGRSDDGERGFRTLATEFERHFGAEERVLFPALEAATDIATGPTVVMRAEHARLCELLCRIDAALDEHDSDGVLGLAGALAIMLQQHDLKEENVVYPICEDAPAARADELGRDLDLGSGLPCPS